jgi:Right handed beta helix region
MKRTAQLACSLVVLLGGITSPRLARGTPAVIQANIVSTGSSTIIDNTNKLCVTILDAGLQVGTKVVEASCASVSNQTLFSPRQPDDFLLLQDAHSGHCLAPVDDATTPGTLLITAVCNSNNTAQEFFAVYQSAPHNFAILNRKSGLCVQHTFDSSQLSLGGCSSTLPLTFTIAGINPPGPNPRPAYAADGIGRAASAPGTPAGTYRTVISDKTFHGDVYLYDSSDTLFINNTIINGNLAIDGATNVYVKGNTIERGEIWFRDESPSNNVVIDGNEIFGSGADGIQLYQDTGGHYVNPTNVRIINNEIHDTGITYPGSGLYHGIYDMVPNVLIENNLFYHNKDAVSIRNSGTISRNFFRNNLANCAIFYEPNHDAPAGSTLLIENNVIDSQVINEEGGLGTNRGLIGLGNGPSVPVTHYIVRFNTVVVEDTVNDGTGNYWDILTQFAFSSGKTGDFYGNILVNSLNTNYLGFNASTYESDNYETQSKSAAGFLNANLEIGTSSPAATLASKETDSPATDRNLQPRPSANGTISSGAYQAQ